MLDLNVAEIEQWISAFFWPFFRIASFVMAAPMLGAQVINMRVRLILALSVTAIVAPLLPEMPAFEGLSLEMFLVIAQQIVVGAMLGFVFQVFYQVFALGGQIIAMQMGLGFASSADPANGVSVVMLSQFYMTMIMLLFLAINGHLIMIEVIVRSFEVVPVGLSSD